MGSVSVLFSDKFTTMVNNLDLLESDHESQEDGQSQASGSTVTTGRRSNNCLRGDLHMSGLSSENDEADDGGSQHSFRQDQRVEQSSTQKSLTGPSGFFQGDSPKKRFQVPPEPRVSETTGQEGRPFYS